MCLDEHRYRETLTNVHLQKTQVIFAYQYGNFNRISTMVHCLFATFSLKFPSSPSIQLFSMQVSDWIITSRQAGAFQVRCFFWMKVDW